MWYILRKEVDWYDFGVLIKMLRMISDFRYVILLFTQMHGTEYFYKDDAIMRTITTFIHIFLAVENIQIMADRF